MLSRHHYAVIMAGGVGSRFWPFSRNKRPKQFLDVLGTGRTLLQMTFDRLSEEFETDNIIVVSHVDYSELVREQLPLIPLANLLFEPQRKNTGPCTALATSFILKRDPDAYILTAPADHLILQKDQFISDVREGFTFLQSNEVLLTFGIQASRPDTGYGYIQFDNKQENTNEIYQVLRFVEKPDHNTALQYLQQGNYVWNSGMFLWKAQTIWNELTFHCPDLTEVFKEINYSDLRNEYSSCRNISIDYAVMEKSQSVFVKKVDFGWSDLGTWGSLYTLLPQDENSNASISEKLLNYEMEGCILYNNTNQLIVVHGLQAYIVINTPDALLICQKSEEQRIKQMLSDIEKKFGKDYI